MSAPDTVAERPKVIPATFCIQCDAPEGECDHGGWRYTSIPNDVDPDWDRERLAKIRAGSPGKTRSVKEEARDVQDLIDEINGSFYIDMAVESQLRAAHELDPLRASRLVSVALTGAANGTLHTPRAFLAKRADEIVKNAP